MYPDEAYIDLGTDEAHKDEWWSNLEEDNYVEQDDFELDLQTHIEIFQSELRDALHELESNSNLESSMSAAKAASIFIETATESPDSQSKGESDE